MKSLSATEGLRFSAKLLFQFRIEIEGTSDIMRLCEERIILLHAKSGRAALAAAKRRGKSSEHSYNNDAGATVKFEFIGVLDLLHLGVECEVDEVWYNITKRKLPKERASEILPAESNLSEIRTLGG